MTFSTRDRIPYSEFHQVRCTILIQQNDDVFVWSKKKHYFLNNGNVPDMTLSSSLNVLY